MLLHVLVERPQQRDQWRNSTLLHNQVPAVRTLAQVLQHHARLRLNFFVRTAQQLDECRNSVELRETLLVRGHYRKIAQRTARLLLNAGVSRRQQLYKWAESSLLNCTSANTHQASRHERTHLNNHGIIFGINADVADDGAVKT